MIKTRRKKTIERLDAMFSEYIRKRAISRWHGCERCLSLKYYIEKDDGGIVPDWRQLDCAHNQSRIHFATRWDEDNALGLCAGCHRFIDREHDAKVEFFTEKLGKAKYDEIMFRAHSVNKTDLAVVELYLKQKLKELQEAIGV